MSNRTQMKERLRRELGDTTAPYIWADDHLDDVLIEAVGWYSRLYPMQTTAYRNVASGQRAFTLPPEVLGVRSVECPRGKLLPEEAEGATVEPTPYTGRLRQAWSVWEGSLWLRNGASGEEVGSNKLAMRVLIPWERPDPSEAWNGPEGDERLLIVWSAAEAWAWLDGQDQRLGRGASGTSGRAGVMAKRYGDELERELGTRRRKVSSRTLSAEC